MRKFTQKVAFALIALLCMIAVPQVVMAQTCVEIGDGTDSKNQLPICGYYHSSYTQQLYLADSLGISAGNITSIAFQYTNATSTKRVISIFMANTDAASLSNAYVTDAEFTEVLSQSVVEFDNSNDWFVIDLETPFAYDGSSNLLVTVYMSYSSAEETHYNSDNRFAYTTATGMARYSTNDNTSSATELTVVNGVLTGNTNTYTGINGTSSSNRPNIQFCYTPAGGGPTCDKPELVEANDVTANSATINWTGSASTYNLQYKASSDQEWTLVKNLTGSSYQLSNLVSNTDYQVQVQAVCGENTSGWKSVSFRTLIDLPYLEQFKSSSIPTGWGRYTGALNDDGSATLTSTDSYWTFGTKSGVFDSHAHMEVYSTRNTWLVTPTIPIPALEPDDPGYLLSFNMALTYWTGDNVPCTSRASQPDARFVVLASLDGGANWNILREWNNTGSAYVYDDIVCSADGEEVEIDLTDYAGQSVQLAFYVYHNSGGDNRIHIDDVFVGLQPTCLKPTDLHEVEGMTTKNSLQVAWTANSGETDWRVQHKVSNDTTAEWITSDVSTNPYTTISGLQPFTNYDVRVAAVCSETDFTDYGKTITIRTAAGVPFVETFDTTALPGEWKRYEVLLENLQNGAPMAPVAAGWNVATASGVFPAANRHLRLNITGADCKYWIVSPTIVMETGYQLTFDLALTKAAGSTPTAVTPGEQNDDKFIVFITGDGGENWNPILTWTNSGEGQTYDQIKPGGQFVKYDLSDYAGQPIQIAFYGESTDADSQSSNYLHIANFKIAEIPACQQANSLIVTDITGSSANAVWEADEAGTWQYGYVVKPEGDFTPTDEQFTGSTEELTVALTGLQETTTYIFFLRKSCGGSASEILYKEFTTIQNPATLPYSADFEENNGGWLFHNGTQPNKWAWGTATSNGGTHALYISSDNGVTNDYAHSATVVFASKNFYFDETGMYSFSFDWKGDGEKNYDYLRVALVPLSTEFTPGTTPSGYSYSALPAGWIALDGGAQLSKQTEWQHVSLDYVIDQTGYYKIALIWKNNGYSGTNPPAAIDNFSIAHLDCTKPTGLAISGITATSATLVWNAETDGLPWVYAYAPASEPEPADDAFIDINVNSIKLEGLAECTSYKFYLRKNCGETTKSESISISFQTKQLPVDAGDSYSEDFEGEAKWLLNNGDRVNAWVIDTAAHNGEGTHALYISNDGGATHAYTNNLACVVFAQKAFNFAAGNYVFSYDWLCNGESTFDFIRVALVPANVELVPGTSLPSGVTYQALPKGCIALDGGSKLNLSETWQTFTSSEIAVPAGTYNIVFMWRDDSSGGDNPPAAIDNFSFAKIACAMPADFHAVDSLATTTSVVLKWTPQGAESDWLVRYRISGAADWADTIHATNDTLLLENLAATTIYEAQVAAWCDPTDDEAVSPFSSPISFTTACEIISTFPYAENFDELTLASAYTPSARTLPTCWSAINTSTHSSYMYYPTAYYYSYTDYSNSKPNSLRFYSYYSSSTDYDPQDQYAILPQIEGISGLRMKFNARKYSSYNSGDSIVVGIMTDPEDISTFEPIQVIKPAAATYEPFEVRFNNYAGEGQYIALKLEAANASNTSRGLHIDDIVVEELPNCLEPEGLAVFDIEENSAKFTWTVEEGESYVYAVALASAGEPAEEAFAAAADSMQINGLVDNKDYILYLRKNCAGNYSPSISAAFHTLMAPATAPFADDFEAGNNWMFINGSLTNAWAYGEAAHNREGTHAIYISNDGGAKNEYTTTANAVVYAVKSFNFEEGVYTFKYDWKAKGEGTSTMFDYLRVFIVPDSVELVPGTSLPTGLTATALPAAWNAIALDGGSAMNGVTSWQTFQTTDIAISAGAYKVVFLWKNDGSGGTNPPAAIDNFSISKITCLPVSELAVSGITSSSATIAWTAPEGQEAWQLAYSADPNFDIAEATPSDVASTTYALADLLTDTLYNVYVRANCGSEDGVSVWSQFSFRTAKACQTPDDLVAAPGLNTAEISWNTYGQTGFNLRYIQGTDTTLVPNVESPYEITGLQPSTAYKVQVQAACESEDSWSAAINFKTAYSTPFEEKFAATSTPDDWVRYSGLLADVLDGGALTTITYGWNFNTGNGVFNNHAKVNIFGTTCKYWLATPVVHVSGNVQLTFDLALTKFSNSLVPVEADAQADDKFAVLISTNNGNSWSVLRLWDNAGSEYVYNNIACSATGEPIAIDLSAYDGQAIKIAFYGESTVGENGDNNLHIDNVLIDLVPTCLKPIGLNISDVKAHSAQLSWTAGDEGQSAWQIAYDTLPTNRPDTLLNIINVTENPYVLSGLAPETRYYAYVRANCGVTDGVSRWTDDQTFKTTIACPAPSALKATITPGNGSIATLNWSAGAEENAWILEYSLNADLSDSIEVLANDTFVNLTGLTAEATYYARVKADCGELDGESLYSATISFIPTNKYELLLNDGTETNAYVPVEGNYVDDATQRSQFVIPAAQLESLEWDSLTMLTFFGSFTSTTKTSWAGATFEAYVLEIEDATLAAEQDWASMTKVMNEASLALVDGQMVVSFSEPYQYQGGNLMIGIKTVQAGDYANVNWSGVTASGASFAGHGTGTGFKQRNFLPKMLINYVPGVAPACPNPKNLAVSGITDSEATFTWKAVEGATWEYALVQGADEPASFISTEENSVTIADLAEATDYTFYLRRACGVDGYSDATLSVAFTTELRVEAVPFVEEFEADGSWKFVNGTESNAWVIGNAAKNGGEKALYISNNGADNTYTKNAASASYATILLDFTLDGEYTFAYDWKANGDYDPEASELYDYLRVVLVPASATLVAGNPALPEGYIALDNGGLYGATDWQHHSSDAQIAAGMYKLVFAWFNDNQQGEDSPAAIDNISIQEKGPETGLINGNAGIFNNGEAIKFLRDNKVFILVNGVIYDATGRKVEVVK